MGAAPEVEGLRRTRAGPWWPAYDPDPEAGHRWVMRRITDADVTTGLCRRRHAVIQAGGHAGLWPIRLSRSFEVVLTFEPDWDLYRALVANVREAGRSNVISSSMALGSRPGLAMMQPVATAGSWRVDPAGTVEVGVTTIDTLGADVDAIVLDVEGYELEVLRGAAETIRRCRPVIHVEELPRSRDAIRAHVLSLGYRLHRVVHGDAIYTPGKR